MCCTKDDFGAADNHDDDNLSVGGEYVSSCAHKLLDGSKVKEESQLREPTWAHGSLTSWQKAHSMGSVAVCMSPCVSRFWKYPEVRLRATQVCDDDMWTMLYTTPKRMKHYSMNTHI